MRSLFIPGWYDDNQVKSQKQNRPVFFLGLPKKVTKNKSVKQKIMVCHYKTKCSMYGLFTYMWVVFGANVGKHTIHWASGKSSRSAISHYLINNNWKLVIKKKNVCQKLAWDWFLAKWNHMGVSKNRETPQNGWLIMENPIKMDDLGGKPSIFGNIHISPTWIFLISSTFHHKIGARPAPGCRLHCQQAPRFRGESFTHPTNEMVGPYPRIIHPLMIP